MVTPLTDAEIDEIEKMATEIEAHNKRVREMDPNSIFARFIEGALSIGRTRQLVAEVRSLRERLTGGGKTLEQLMGNEPYTVEQSVAGVMQFYQLPDNGVRACMIMMLKDRDKRIGELEAALHEIHANRLADDGDECSCTGCSQCIARIALGSAIPPADDYSSNRQKP